MINTLIHQYFIKGGKLVSAAVKDVLKGKTERNLRIGLLNKELGKTLDGLAHDLWESRPNTEDELTTRDYKNAVENVIRNHYTKESMINEILGKEEKILRMNILMIQETILNLWRKH